MQKESFSKIIIPSLTVFLSSACIMIIELVASRLIARHLGSSLYTWTSVIGVVLAGITIGNYLGGRIADKYSPRKALSTLFCLASIACVVIIILNNIVGEWIWLWQLSWPMRVFTHISLVFLLPSVLLGTISPVVAKMALDRGLPAGRTVGDIYAFGAAGSIAGTFLAGFYLIAAMGTIAIIWTVAFFLLVMALAYRIKAWPIYIWAIILIVFFFLSFADIAFAKQTGSAMLLREKTDPSILYENETPYCWVAVKQLSQEPDHRLFLQDKLKHSDVIMGNVGDLQYFHTIVFSCITKEISKSKKTFSTFSIGGGGYAFPQYLESTYPSSHNVVAEIDPGVTEAAHAAFGLSRDTKIQTVTLDARNYVDGLLEDMRQGEVTPQFDFIYEDAFSDYNVPFQLVTKEFHDKLDQILTDDGIYMINMIDVLDIGHFLGTYINTLKQTFPHVYAVTEPAPRNIRTTFSIIASKVSLDVNAIIHEHEPSLQYRYLDESEIETLIEHANGMTLTDDFSPVDNMLAPVVRQSAKELLADKYLEMGRKLKAEGDFQKSNEFLEITAQNNPSLFILAYNEIGMNYVSLQQPLAAAESFRKAIDFYYNSESKQQIIGSLHLNLGILYSKLNDTKQASEQFKLAAERFREEVTLQPDNHVAYSRLGESLAMVGKYNEATEAFRKAVELVPDNHQYYGNLIRVLLIQKKYDQAIPVLKEQIALLEKEGDTVAAEQARQYLQTLLDQ